MANLHSTPDLTLACQPTTHRGRALPIDGHAASRYIAYCNGKTVILRSVANPLEAQTYTEHAYPTTVARFSPNGEWVASGDASGFVRVWARGGEHKLKNELKALGGSIEDLQWSADGQRILVGGDGKINFVRAFMWDSGGNLGEFEGHHKRVLSCAYRPARPFRVFSCGEDFQVNYYEGPPFRFKASNKEHGNFVNCVRFSPDGARVITVSSDRKALLFDGKTGEKTGALSDTDAHSGSVYAVSWSPDGKQVVTVSADKTAKIWKVAEDGTSGEVVATYTFPTQPSNTSTPPPSGKPAAPSVDYMQVGCVWLEEDLIVTVSLNGDINLFSPTTGLPPSSVPQGVLVGHSKYVTSLAVNPDAKAGEGETEGAADLLSASYDGKVVRWREGVGALGVVEGEGHAHVIAIACGGGNLLTVGLDDTLRVTPLPALRYASDTVLALDGQPCGLSLATNNPSLSLVATVKGITLVRGASVLCTLALPYEPTAAALSPDGKTAAVGAEDHVVRLLSVDVDGDQGKMEEVAKLERHRGPITALAFSPDGTMLASGDQNREAVVWDVATREVKIKNMVYHTARVSAIAWSPDSTTVATAALDMQILVYKVGQPPSQRTSLKGTHAGGVTSLAFVGPSRIVSAGHDACIRYWTLP